MLITKGAFTIAPRPCKCRRVEHEPKYTYFKPAGVPLFELKEQTLSIEELEAIRLKDLEGLDQTECAQKMNVSRPTFQRIINQARIKVATALVEGGAIKVEGGSYELAQRKFVCLDCGHGWEVPFGNGMHGRNMICPACSSSNIKRSGAHETDN